MADVLRVSELARLKLTRDGVVAYDQAYAPAAESYTEHAGDRVVLATNMATPEAVDLGGIATAEHLMLETERTILVGVNSQTNLITVKKALMVVSSFSTLYLQNESTTNTATVEFMVTD